MSRLILVRHGQAAASWGEDADPGLSETGRAQAEAMASAVSESLAAPQPIEVSPLRRTRETAAALEARWATEAAVVPAIGEVPSPGLDLSERGAWLATLMGGTWDEADPDTRRWRDALVDHVAASPSDRVIVTHFVAINVVVGAARDDPRVRCFSPGYCSRTIVEATGGRLEVVALGGQAATAVR